MTARRPSPFSRHSSPAGQSSTGRHRHHITGEAARPAREPPAPARQPVRNDRDFGHERRPGPAGCAGEPGEPAGFPHLPPADRNRPGDPKCQQLGPIVDRASTADSASRLRPDAMAVSIRRHRFVLVRHCESAATASRGLFVGLARLRVDQTVKTPSSTSGSSAGRRRCSG